jgi:hypothetical protein
MEAALREHADAGDAPDDAKMEDIDTNNNRVQEKMVKETIFLIIKSFNTGHVPVEFKFEGISSPNDPVLSSLSPDKYITSPVTMQLQHARTKYRSISVLEMGYIGTGSREVPRGDTSRAAVEGWINTQVTELRVSTREALDLDDDACLKRVTL